MKRKTRPKSYKGRRAVFTFDYFAQDRYALKGGGWERSVHVSLGSRERIIWFDSNRYDTREIHKSLQIHSIRKSARDKSVNRVTTRTEIIECFRLSATAKKGHDTVAIVDGRTEYTHDGQVVAVLEGRILTLDTHEVDSISRRTLLNGILDAFRPGDHYAFSGIIFVGMGFGISYFGHILTGPLRIDLEEGRVLSDLNPVEQYAKLSRLRGERQIAMLARKLSGHIPVPDDLPPKVLAKLVEMRLQGIL